MKVFSLARYAFGIAAGVALLAGCSANGSTPSLGGSSASGVAPMANHGKVDFATFQKLTAMTNAMHKGVPPVQHALTHSWMKKPPHGATGTLWATDVEYGTVDAISYPSGTLIGQVSGFSFPQGDCSDNNGNVYVGDAGTGYGYEISGGTVVNSWFTDGYTIGCSVSLSGDVAFTNFYSYFSPYTGGVWVFPGGGASGNFYAGPGDDWPAGYDKHGALYVECNYVAPCSSPHLAVLNGSTWQFMNFDGTITFPGAVQGLAPDIGVADQEPGGQFYTGVYFTNINGTGAHVTKSYIMQGGSTCSSSYMDDSTSWANISKKPNGVQKKKMKNAAAANLWCFPSPINLYGKKAGAPIGSFQPVTSQYDYGVTMTKP